jgi:hypothetical protein
MEFGSSWQLTRSYQVDDLIPFKTTSKGMVMFSISSRYFFPLHNSFLPRNWVAIAYA